MIFKKFKKIFHWEYWPFTVFYFPIFFYWLYLSIKSKSLLFFSTSNPGIEYSGFLGEQKMAILDKIKDTYKPRSVFIPAKSAFSLAKKKTIGTLRYPFILKPNIGERGRQVEKITNEQKFKDYWKENQVDVIAQEYIDLPNEYGVFYHRIPGQKNGRITSIVIKKFLSVIGDGQSTVLELMQSSERSERQIDRMKIRQEINLDAILPKGQEQILEPIGNHNRGTAFLNGNHLIGPEINKVFTEISESIEGFYFGRFDLRCTNDKDLKSGKHIKILELNGAGSEPAHIYDPKTSIFEAYKQIIKHLNLLQKIAVLNHKKGIPFMTICEALSVRKMINKHQSKLNIK